MKNFIEKVIKWIKKTDKVLLLISFLVLIYSSYFSYFTIQRHMNFYSGRYDLGNMDQTVWNTLHGKFFIFTNPDVQDQLTSRLAVHSDFILIFLAPFYLIWEDPRMLLLIQSVIIGCGAFFIYLIGKITLQQRLIPFVLTLSYLLNPYIERQNIFDFHAVSLATTFLTGAFYFLYRKKYIWFGFFSLMAALTKEHIFVIVGLFGLYIFFIQKKRWGIFFSVICFTIFYLLVSKFIPEARSTQHFALSYYKDFGDSPKEVIQTFFTNPIQVSTLLYNNGIFPYLQSLFASVGFISLLSPYYFIFALPEFFINMLSQKSLLRSIYYHYAAAIIPFVYISATFGVRRLTTWLPHKKTKVIIAIYLLICTMYSAWLYGPLPGAKGPDLKPLQERRNKEAIHNYLKTISPSTIIAVDNTIAAHLIHREKIYKFENGLEKADLLLFLVSELDNPNTKNIETVTVQRLLKDSNYKLVYRIDDFLVFKRVKK